MQTEKIKFVPGLLLFRPDFFNRPDRLLGIACEFWPNARATACQSAQQLDGYCVDIWGIPNASDFQMGGMEFDFGGLTCRRVHSFTEMPAALNARFQDPKYRTAA